MASDATQGGGLGASLFRAAALAEYPTLLKLLDILLAKLLHRDRLAGAIAALQRIIALGDFRQRLDRERASLFGGHGAMPAELHAPADIVGVSVKIGRAHV